MVESHSNELLNQVLVNLSRSLLQYVGECWPFTTRDAAERNRVADCVNAQRDAVQGLANLLMDRDWHIDFGAFPTEYTDLHFVDLDYLLPEVLEGEQSVSRDLELALERCFEDSEAVAVLRDVLVTQTRIVSELRSLVASRTGSAA